jgi:hypothetical protein
MPTTHFKAPLRPARLDEIGFVQQHVAMAVDELFDVASEFSLAEKARFNARFIEALMQADPGYVVIVQSPHGERAGFIVGVPEMGTMILSWGYIQPAFRKGTLAMRAFGEFVRLWDKRNFHKMIYYALPDNRQSEAIGRHAKFERVALLRRQFFGVDFVMYEKLYTKLLPGHAPAVSSRGWRGRMMSKLRNLVPPGQA